MKKLIASLLGSFLALMCCFQSAGTLAAEPGTDAKLPKAAVKNDWIRTRWRL